MNGRSLLRIARAARAARGRCIALIAGLLAGCGGVTGGRVLLGYPTDHPQVTPAAALQLHLDGEVVRLAVPAGWGLAHLDPARDPSFVHRDGACYLSISITGSSSRTLTRTAVADLYDRPVGGHAWSVVHVGTGILALLGELDTATRTLSRSSLGTAYLPTSAHTYLAIDYGAGIWPLDGQPCSDSAVSARLPPLTAAIEGIFHSAQLAAPAGASTVPARAGVAAVQRRVSA